MYTLHNTLKISDLRKHTVEVMKEVENEIEPVTVFSRSEPKIVIMSFNLYQRIKNKNANQSAQRKEKSGIDFFIDPPEDMIIKGKGLSAVEAIRAER